MRMDVTEITFSGVAGGGTLAELNVSDVFQVGIAVQVASFTGTPTSFRAIAVALDGTTAIGGATEHLRKTADMTAAGYAYLGQRGSAVGEVALENAYPKIRIIADFTGGAAPTVTGKLLVFTKRV